MRFEHCADSYDEHAEPQRAFAARVAAFIGSVPSSATVLEFGAGTGALTRYLHQSGFSVVATDVSPSMVREGSDAVPEADWRLLDAFIGPIPRSSLQVSSGLLQWATAPSDVLALWRNSLEPGARMVHAFPCEPCLQEWRAILPESPIHWRNASEWRQLFEAAGLGIRRQEVWVEKHVVPSALHLARAFHASGVTGSAKVSTARLRHALRTYDQQNRTSNGVVSTWAWLAIEAVPR